MIKECRFENTKSFAQQWCVVNPCLPDVYGKGFFIISNVTTCVRKQYDSFTFAAFTYRSVEGRKTEACFEASIAHSSITRMKFLTADRTFCHCAVCKRSLNLQCMMCLFFLSDFLFDRATVIWLAGPALQMRGFGFSFSSQVRFLYGNSKTPED